MRKFERYVCDRTDESAGIPSGLDPTSVSATSTSVATAPATDQLAIVRTSERSMSPTASAIPNADNPSPSTSGTTPAR